jgi:hypothetical protein
MGVTQPDREVGRPANGAESECMICPNKRKEHVTEMGCAPDTRENSRGARLIRGGAGVRTTIAVWYGPEGKGLDRGLLHVDVASEDGLIVGEEPRVAGRK